MTKLTKREIMKRAHEIAKTLEGDYRARLVIGLRQAWREAKEMEKATATYQTYRDGWVAEIRGKDKKFGFDRKFVKGEMTTKYIREFVLEQGLVYEIKDKKERFFARVDQDGCIEELTKEEVLAMVS